MPDRNWNLLFVDGQEIFRFFDEPLHQYKIESIMYVFNADVPKITVNREGVRSYEFTIGMKSIIEIGEME